MDLRQNLYPGLVRGLVALALVLAAVTAAAQPPAETPASEKAQPHAEKPPWAWTLEERLNARFDPQKIRERMKNRGHNPQIDLDLVPESFEVLSGKEHPHLILPSRVFDAMLDEAFAPDAEDRARKRQHLHDRFDGGLEIDEAFWRDLSIITATYLQIKLEYEALERQFLRAVSQNSSEASKLQSRRDARTVERCRARRQALDAAREFFGQEEFDRFLYETSAAHLWEAGEWGPGEQRGWARIERGCPHGV